MRQIVQVLHFVSKYNREFDGTLLLSQLEISGTGLLFGGYSTVTIDIIKRLAFNPMKIAEMNFRKMRKLFKKLNKASDFIIIIVKLHWMFNS